MTLKTWIFAAFVAALIAASGLVAAVAYANPSGGSANATALEPTSSGTARSAVSVSWSLGAGETSCALYWNASDGYTPPRGEVHLGASDTSWSGTVEDGTPGQTLYFRVVSSTDGCFTTLPSGPIALTVPTYAAPVTTTTVTTTDATTTTPTATTSTTPVGAPTATANTTTTPTPTTTTPTTDCDLACLEARVATLEDEYTKLAARVDAIVQANAAAWQTYHDDLVAGVDPATAALDARSAGLNAIYELSPAA